jgi:lipid-A-disaccharide synthase
VDGERTAPFRVALLPGSRRSEVDVLLPVMLESVRRLAALLPVEAQVIRAPTIPRQVLADSVAAAGVDVEIAEGDRFATLAETHLALCASGTATLEVGLVGTPLLVLYRLAPWTYLAAKLLVRLPHVSLVNLVLGEAVAPELIQGAADPERVAREAAHLLRDRRRVDGMRRDLAHLRDRLGEGGASARAARQVAARLGGAAPPAGLAAGVRG